MDHKLLLVLFAVDKPVPDRTFAQLKYWTLTLMGYSHNFHFMQTTKHANADACQFNKAWTKMKFSVGKVAVATQQDKASSMVLHAMKSSWPDLIKKELDPFHKHKSELAVENGFIPKDLQSAVLTALNEEHPDTTKMKNLARTRGWQEIKETFQKCLHFQGQRVEAAPAPVHSWELPAKP
ncbi:hypothetical protein J437_LFUL012711 [Ladona fulva]|uniref:Uncharacterized protein n=1 Tax=Ladona fulva TaxID=123851 RepID=A0A8K0KC73_LADFU|nr:hypothetical protein J437_LFUL012711 [Ladona fulva]